MKKQSTNVTYVPEVIQRGGGVLSCAPVRKIVFRGDTAIGVTGHFVHPITKKKGRAFIVHARHAVVVAASVTHTPVLLRRSGIRDTQLGHHFRAHPWVWGNRVLR